ncbi:MAG: DUF3108 domain-containing protein [Magnetococcus sp. DMHC-1]
MNLNHSRLLLCALLSVLAGGCASTGATPNVAPLADRVAESVLPSGQAPQWRVGDEWTYSDGYALRVAEVDGEAATLQRLDQPGQWVKRKGLFKLESQDAGAHRQTVFRGNGDPAGIFPLELGKKVEFTREYMADKQLRVHDSLWVVEGRQTIEVPAGTFDCWVLTMTTKSRNSDWQSVERWWYSPEIKHYVRLEYRYGNTPASSRVLMRYDVKG